MLRGKRRKTYQKGAAVPLDPLVESSESEDSYVEDSGEEDSDAEAIGEGRVYKF